MDFEVCFLMLMLVLWLEYNSTIARYSYASTSHVKFVCVHAVVTPSKSNVTFCLVPVLVLSEITTPSYHSFTAHMQFTRAPTPG